MKILSISILAAILLAPVLSYADSSFVEKVQLGKSEINSRTEEQLSNADGKVFYNAFLTAKIIGYDPDEIKHLRADVAELRQENAQLRAQLSSTGRAVPSYETHGLAARVVKLENSLAGLQDTLSLVVKMLTAILAKM